MTTTMTRNQNIHKLVVCAMLAAIIIVMAFTPIGYLKIGPVSITFLTIPVVIGAVVLGPAAGCVLGGIFGLTSFFQCFGMDAFGTVLCGINPFFTFVMCVIPRVCIGLFSGLLFRALSKVDKTRIVSFIASTLLGAITNTILFVGLLILFFSGTEIVQQNLGSNVWEIILALVTANSLIEIAVCAVIGTAISKVITRFVIKQ